MVPLFHTFTTKINEKSKTLNGSTDPSAKKVIQHPDRERKRMGNVRKRQVLPL